MRSEFGALKRGKGIVRGIRGEAPLFSLTQKVCIVKHNSMLFFVLYGMKNIKEKVAKAIDAPREIFFDESKVTIFEDREILIENYKTMLEYDDCFIRVKLKHKDIAITGKDFILDEMTDESMIIRGSIAGIEFL